MEAEFTTTIDAHFLDYPIEAHITYKAIPTQSEGRYITKHGYEIEVIDTKYTSYGCEVHVEGKTWDRLEEISLERAEEHFFEQGEAA